jgi:hypothetical protein
MQWLRGSGKSRSDQPVELERFFSNMYGQFGAVPLLHLPLLSGSIGFGLRTLSYQNRGSLSPFLERFLERINPMHPFSLRLDKLERLCYLSLR